MDLFYFAIRWLKSIIEQLKSITSFISGNFLPEIEAEEKEEKKGIFG